MSNNTSTWVVIPNWNGKNELEKCLVSLEKISGIKIVVVDNNSSDGSVGFVKKSFPNAVLVQNQKNLGFAGGVNVGIEEALKSGATYVALLNNDVTVDKEWIERGIKALTDNTSVGAVTGTLFVKDGSKVDNTGDEYSIWGLTIPRDRGVKTEDLKRPAGEVFGACAGAGIYKAKVFENSGLFDEKFFAYYEDSDLNFRMQLAGWETLYEPKMIAYHDTGATSKKIPGFTTLQTIKNPTMLFWKNVPLGLLPRMFPRFFISHSAVFFSTIFRGQIFIAMKGVLICFKNVPHTFKERWKIQKSRKVSNGYIWSVLYKDLPPNARRLRRFRKLFTGKN